MQKLTLLVAGAFLGLTALAWAENNQVVKDDKGAAALVGTWAVTAEEKNGKKETASIKDKQVRITRDTITCYDNTGNQEMKATYKVDTSRTPWEITLNCTKGDHKDKTLKGIVKLDGDSLQICHSKPDGDVPTSFSTKAGQCCLTLERAKR